MKLAGRTETALAACDENVRLFPYDLICVSARSDLLKELGDFANAIKGYDTLIEKWPGFLAAKTAKAAIHVALGEYGKAELLLPSNPPSTRDEWIAHHIRGMILLKTGRLEEAITHFTKGTIEIPYAYERRYYANALAIARLRRGEYAEAISVVDRQVGAVTNVIRLHAFAASGQVNAAKTAYTRVLENCPPKLIELRDELASKFGMRSAAPKHNDAWLFEKECEGALLLAA